MHKFPWKSSYRSIPPFVTTALAQIKSDLVIVAATKKIPVQKIADGLYAHVGLTHDGSNLNIAASVVPKGTVGKFADRNRNGWEVKRHDLPKVTKTYSWETPNFGDASTYGTHTHHQDREVYQVQAFEPRMFPIRVELLNSAEVKTALIKFEVGQLLDKNSDGFQDDLLFCVNLLQESTGVTGVHAKDAKREDFIATVRLDWEVFPPGHAAEFLAAVTKGSGGVSAQKAGIVAARIKLFNKLPVEQFIYGTGSFGTSAGAYIGALYADDLVVFENMTYGNAMYVLYDDWKDVSKRSRLELLYGTSAKFDRIIHSDGWEDRFLELIGRQLQKRRPTVQRHSPKMRRP
jgi:hypothetical protein